MKCPTKGVRRFRVSSAIHTGGSIVDLVQGNLRMSNLALVVGNPAKSIVQDGKKRSSAACHNAFHRILSGSCSRLSEVADYMPLRRLMFLFFRSVRRRPGSQQ